MVTATRPGTAAAPAKAYFGITDTAIGPMLVAGDGRRLVAIKFHTDERTAPDAIADLERETGGAYRFVRDDRRVAGLARQVAGYVSGRRTSFDVDLDLSWISGFRRDVMLACAASRAARLRRTRTSPGVSAGPARRAPSATSCARIRCPSSCRATASSAATAASPASAVDWT
jgi:hypothetical protein